MTSAGSAYTSTPTVSITGGGGTAAAGTPLVSFGVLAQAQARISKVGTTVYKYAWDLDEVVEINENALIQVVERHYGIQNRFIGYADTVMYKPIVMRIHELGTKSVVNAKNLPNDNFFQGKIINIGQQEKVLQNDIKLEINPQSINRIVLSLDYGMTEKTGFYKDDDFVIILKITEKEPSLVEYGSLNNINTTQ